MIPETRDEETYQLLSSSTRFLIRIIVYFINLLNKKLKPYNMTPIFAIYDLSEMEESLEDKEIMQ